MPWKAGLFSGAVSSRNTTIGVQSSARAAFLSRAPHSIGTPAPVLNADGQTDHLIQR